MSVGVDIGFAFADFVIRYRKKLLEPVFMARISEQIDKLTEDYPQYRSNFIEFFSIKKVPRLLENLQGGSMKDFEELLSEFKTYCSENDVELDIEKMLEKMKHDIESLEADSNLTQIILQYLQQTSKHNKKVEKKLEVMHKDIKKIEEKDSKSRTAKSTIKVSEKTVQDYFVLLKSRLVNEPETKFAMTFSSNENGKESIELEDWARSRRKIILHGAAGGGKSMMVNDLARKLIDKESIPVLLDLKDWSKDFSAQLEKAKSASIEEQMDILLKISGVMNVDLLSHIEGEKWIIVDGLNEISAGQYGEKATKTILDVVGEYVRKNSTTYALVSDRLSKRSFAFGWTTAYLNSLSEDEVRKRIGEKFGTEKFDQLEEHEKRLLSIPFFLDYALKSDSPSLGSEAKVLENFFKVQSQFTDDDLNRLSESAFNAYQKYGSLVFDSKKFEEWTSKSVYEKLLSDGIVVSNKDKARFNHQLLHDYLVSRHMALNDDHWTLEGFDIASLESNSLETIILVLEQLEDPRYIDKFLEAVYDWNWPAAISCTSRATAMGSKGPSKEMEVVMVALAAQKIFEPMYQTSRDAKNRLDKFGTDTANDFSNSKDIDELLTKVKSIESSVDWFIQWRNFFTKDRDSDVSEEEIKMIKEKTSLLGWTAANLLKQCKLTKDAISFLQNIFNVLDENEPHHNTVRWRVVHTLGAFDSKDNAEFLFKALDKDPYHWARYGAARSLIEMAARTSNEDLRDSIIDGLKNRVMELEQKILGEIGKSVFYRILPANWVEKIIPLLEECKKAQTGQDYIDRWTEIIEDFKKGQWKDSE